MNNFGLQLFYNLSSFLHDNSLSIYDHMEEFFYMAFHKLESDLSISI